MQAADIERAIDRLKALIGRGPGDNPDAVHDLHATLGKLEAGASAYTVEKVAALRDSFTTWLSAAGQQLHGSDSEPFKAILRRDIERLHRALARGSESQD